MSEIIKTEAVVLSKINYSESSHIVTLFTKDYGKLSAIVKGGRRPKSKIGLIVDPMNYLQIVIYNKETRDIQILSSADILAHFPKIKDDYDKLKYAYAILELLKKLTVEHEANEKLFRGLIRILDLINTSNELPITLFGRFFIFFLTELGYELQLDTCAVCGRTNPFYDELSYNFEIGTLCIECKKNHLESFKFDGELFRYLLCLKNSKTIDNQMNYGTKESALMFLEKYLIYHVPDFKGIQTFQLFK